MQGNPHIGFMPQDLGLTPEQQQQFDALTPDAQRLFVEAMLRDTGAAVSAAEQQMSRADALRFNPQARGRRAGGMYVAANPLEHVVDVLRHKKGVDDYRTAQQARQKALDDEAAFKGRLSNILINRSDALRGMEF